MARGLLCIGLILLLASSSLGCGGLGAPASPVSSIKSYRDVPGVTADEISAIDAFKASGSSFTYGALLSTEAFQLPHGAWAGFVVLFCDFLTELFGVPFKPALHEWDDLLTGLESRAIDFTGDVALTDKRWKTRYMTDPITEHRVKYVRIVGSASFTDIAALRPLRFAFLDSAAIADAVAACAQHPFETIGIDTIGAAYALLKSGRADAFFAKSSTETAAFDAYSDVVTEDFFPLIYRPVSLSTQNPALEPIILVAQKALRHGGARRLTELYKLG
ncbi:MAG: transporter substrate-binding domain-containing protein, partial [Clostridiales bacterium]|nr:transporter substrate-binding domain-containing protein [Clostridiales bacterium]